MKTGDLQGPKNRRSIGLTLNTALPRHRHQIRATLVQLGVFDLAATP